MVIIMNKIVVLMSTYNGEKYISEQIESILAQDIINKNIKLSLIIRDDGSKDNSVNIIREYENKYPDIIKAYSEKNCGVIKSFFELLKKAPEAEYYAFSDQDDYWMPDKLSRAVKLIESKKETAESDKELPVLYCCLPKLVDGELNPIESNISRPIPRVTFENALVENVCTGCTEVFNKKLYEILMKELPGFTVMHDWWLYLVAECFGEVIYDSEPHILYRQHADNVLGTKTGYIAEFKERFKRFKANRRNISNQVSELVRIYGNENEYWNEKTVKAIEKAKEFVNVRKSFGKRVKFMHNSGIYRQRKLDDVIFDIIIFFGSY